MQGTKVLAFQDGTMQAVAVEDLKIGDKVLVTHPNGLGYVEKPIKWIGKQRMLPQMNIDPNRYLPIRIKAMALGNMPHEDVVLSPDHAVLIDNVLVQAGAMVNGETVCQEQPTAEWVYYNIEVEEHTCLVVSGMLCESYVNNTDGLAFDNIAERPARDIVEMPYPRAKSWRQVPPTVKEMLNKTVPADKVAV